MDLQWTPFTLPIVLAALILCCNSAYLIYRWRRDPTIPGIGLGAGLVTCFAITLLFFTVELSVTAISLKILFNQFQYLSWAHIGAFLLSYVLVYTGRESLLTPRVYAMLFIPGVLTVIFVMTNDFHWLHWTDVYNESANSYIMSVNEHGPLFFWFIFHTYLFVVIGLLILLRTFFRSHGVHRWQTGGLIIGILAPAVGGVIYVLGLVPRYYPSPPYIACIVTAIAFTWPILRHDLFTILPIARRIVIEQMTDGMLVCDNDGIIIDVNPAMLSLLGRTRPEVLKRDVETVLAPSVSETGIDERSEAVQSEMDGNDVVSNHGTKGSSRSAEVTIFENDSERKRIEQVAETEHYNWSEYPDDVRTEPDGSIFEDRKTVAIGETIVDMSISPITRSDEVVGRVITFRNVTDLVEYRNEIERQNEQLEQFASVVSHDLRNPLMVVNGWIDIAEEREAPINLEPVRRALDRMDRLISELLSLARAGETVRETELTSVSDVASRAWASVETASATLTVESDRPIDADPNRLQQAFENLFRNAIEHGGDSVSVTVTGKPTGFVVEDDGPGIAPELGDLIFEWGVTSTSDGTGYGLSIVEQIVEAHGWHIRVDPNGGDNGGATFEISQVTPVHREENHVVVE